MSLILGTDLVTEGVLTISKAIQLMRQAKGDKRNLPALPLSCDEELV
jgi:hypothetical protein